MKKWVLLGVGFLLFVTMVGAEEKSDYRAFTAMDGRTLEARIVDYEPKSRKATLELRNGKRKMVHVSVFSEDDRPQFLDWFIQNEMLSPTKFVVKIVEQESAQGSSAPATEGWKVTRMATSSKVYEIQLDNKSHYPVEDFLVEYRVFYESRRSESFTLVELGGGSFLNRGGSSSLGIDESFGVDVILCEQGEIGMAAFPSKKRSNQKTSAVWLKSGKEERTNSLNGSLAVKRGRRFYEHIMGLQVRVSAPLSDGTRAGKIYAYPPEFIKAQKVDWTAGPRNGLYVVYNPFKQRKNEKIIECADVVEGRGRSEVLKRYVTPELYFALKGWILGYDEGPRHIGDMFMNGTHGVERDEKAGLSWYEVGADGKDLDSLAKLAWYYGGNKDKKKRDAEKAEEAADRLMKLKPKEPDHKAAVAAAYAQSGHFKAAISIQKEVVEADDGKAQRESLKRYEQGLKYEAR